MKYTRFEELPVWQAAIRLGVEVYTLTSDEAFKGQRSLRDQLERAAVSVSNNIAEGFERGTTNERTPRFPPHRARLGGRSPFDALLTRKITRLQWLSFEIS